jgi:hypothetical protein
VTFEMVLVLRWKICGIAANRVPDVLQTGSRGAAGCSCGIRRIPEPPAYR